MKAELNNQNKAKFFALYWGQEVGWWNKIIHAKIVNELRIVNNSFIAVNGQYSPQLLLKPLSQISDQDAIEIMNIVYPNSIEEDYEKIISFRNIFLHEETVCQSYQLVIYGEHLLRSKGYALPFMGLSVEELVEAGWIKLTEI